jgi:hypothetical protein
MRVTRAHAAHLALGKISNHLQYNAVFNANQFLSSCELAHTRYQWCYGLSADFWNIHLRLILAMHYLVPCIIAWEENKSVLSVSIRGIMEEISLHSKTAHAGATKTSSASGLHDDGQFDASV